MLTWHNPTPAYKDDPSYGKYLTNSDLRGIMTRGQAYDGFEPDGVTQWETLVETAKNALAAKAGLSEIAPVHGIEDSCISCY